VNALENWFCATSFWRSLTQNKLLPWIVSGSSLGDHLLEVGSGPGAATPELKRLVPRVTSIEYSHAFAVGLTIEPHAASSQVVQGDASTLPFVDASFSAAVAILMLHHLQSAELQDRAFIEILRVLRPGGVFFAFEIQDGWLQRAIHRHSTFVPVAPASLPARLSAVGFARVMVNSRPGGFRVRAHKDSIADEGHENMRRLHSCS
jgi:ubiquinone/menaquinone biosynthesis C-methylase UbiE